MSTAVQDPLVGRLVDRRYAVRSRIARGGMATVYLATDTRLERDVALKVMHPHLADDEEFVARFHREAKSAASLSHPNVVAVYDQGAQGDTVYLAMEYVPGQTLRDVMAADAPLTPREALGILEPVLDALGAAHRAGLIHRDVKPENVLLAEDGRVKVVDFGLARAASGSTSGTTQSMLIGTVAYLSPELVLRGVADARSDVYAAGVMLFEMLTGRQPFAGEVPIQVAYQHVNSEVPAPSSTVPGLPPGLDDLVLQATARDPDRRPADARVLLGDLCEVRSSLSEAELDHEAAPLVAPAEGSGATLAIPRHESALALPVGEADPAADPATDPATDPAAQPALEGELGAAGTPGAAGARGDRGRRRRLPLVLAVAVAALLAAAGGLWWFLAGPGADTTVPDVVGRTQAEAERLVSAAGLEPSVAEQYDDEVAEGQVVATDPGAGQELRRGGTVEVVVSAGPEFVAVPEVAGLPLEEARAALSDAELSAGEVTEAYSEDVAQGLVVSQLVVPGETIRRSVPVDLVVSRGREPVDVPVVTGLPRAEAEAALAEAGLALGAATSEPSETVPEGSVISQAPAQGTLFRGDPVSLVVSSGPPLVPVPDVVGQQVGPATEALEAAGFAVEVEEVLGGYFGTVRSQDPEGGSEARRGSTVVLTVV